MWFFFNYSDIRLEINQQTFNVNIPKIMAYHLNKNIIIIMLHLRTRSGHFNYHAAREEIVCLHYKAIFPICVVPQT